MTIDVTGVWSGLKEALHDELGFTPSAPPAQRPITMNEFWARWEMVTMMLIAYLLWPDRRDDCVGEVGTEPRDTWDGQGESPTVGAGYAAIDW